MNTLTSKGVEVTVEVFYQSEYSKPLNNEHMFAYRITIVNLNTFSIQLLRRHWFIFDSLGESKEVEGEGVIGQQPVINPGDSYQYISGSNLNSELGKMWGHYSMIELDKLEEFLVEIPSFDLIAPQKNN